jgi:hypothetical protein
VAAPAPRAYVVSAALAREKVPALSGAHAGGHGGNGNGHRPVQSTDLTPWGRSGDAPEGWS